jgi:hypothetical protein
MPVTTSPAKNALKPAAKPDVVKLRPGAVKPDAAKPDVATPVPGAVGPENKDQNLSDAIKKQSSEDDKSKLASSTGGSTVLSMAASVLKGVVFIGVGFYAAYKFLESNSPDTIAKVLSWTRKGGTSLPVPAGKKK